MGIKAEALETLYRERYATYRAALATITGSAESAHDVVQDAFADALQHLGSFRGEGTLAAWVWTIALRRAWRTVQRRPDTLSDPDALPALAAAERDPELAAALRRLSPQRRLMVFLRYFGGLSYAEVAQALDVSPGRVAAALLHA